MTAKGSEGRGDDQTPAPGSKRYMIIGGHGDGPMRGGTLVVTPSEAVLGEKITLSGSWRQRQDVEGSPVEPLTAAQLIAAFLPMGVELWREDQWIPIGEGETDAEGRFRITCAATESGVYRVSVGVRGNRTSIISDVLVTVAEQPETRP